MLNKETKQLTEEMRGKLAPLFAKAEKLGEKLRKNQGKSESIYIYRDGTSWDSFASDNFYCYLKIKIWGVCGMSASDWGTYSKHTSEIQRQYKQAQEPKLYTHAQYIKLVKQLKELENKAKEITREHHEKARASGLIYFTGGLADPVMNVWGKND